MKRGLANGRFEIIAVKILAGSLKVHRYVITQICKGKKKGVKISFHPFALITPKANFEDYQTDPHELIVLSACEGRILNEEKKFFKIVVMVCVGHSV